MKTRSGGGAARWSMLGNEEIGYGPDTWVTENSRYMGDSGADQPFTNSPDIGDSRSIHRGRVARRRVTGDRHWKQSTSGTWVTPELHGWRMPWKTTCPMDERVKFIAAYLRGELAVSRLCEAFGVSRKTAYKTIARYTECFVAELLERSTRPLSHPKTTSPEVASLIVATRKEHPFWGPKKLVAVLRTGYPGLQLPATGTIGHLLARRGLTHPRRATRRSSPYGEPFLGYDKSNAVWCADFKGHFRLADRTRCHPLTISDGFSRYLLRCEALRHPRYEPTRAVFEQTFREYGLPDAIRTDNGPPFSSLTLGGLSHLAVWWLPLGIRPERIKTRRPDQDGRHQRMHRKTKHDAVGPT